MVDVEASEDQILCFTFRYTEVRPDPLRVLDGSSAGIRVLASLDEMLLRPLGPGIESQLELLRFEEGSLKTWLVNQLKVASDADLRSMNWKPIVGAYLVKARKALIGWLTKQEQLQAGLDVQPIQEQLHELAMETNVKRLADYPKIPRRQLLGTSARIARMAEALETGETVSFVQDGIEFEVPAKSISLEGDLEDLLTHEELKNEAEVFLKVKKPDFLGNSQWEFRHRDSIIRATVVDVAWLSSFRDHQLALLPGDSIRALLTTTTKYDDSGEVISVKNDVTRVLEKIDGAKQLTFLEPEGPAIL